MFKSTGSVPAVSLAASAASSPRISLTRAFSDAVFAALAWHDRARQRHHLMGLDEHQLKDIGVSRAEAEHEARKPFWRP